MDTNHRLTVIILAASILGAGLLGWMLGKELSSRLPDPYASPILMRR